MILLVAPAATVIVAILRGGKLLRLVSLPLRWPGVPALAFTAQAVVIYFLVFDGWEFQVLRAAILILSYLALLLTVCINRRIPGMALLGIGLVLNLAVILANGGYMPVTPETMQRIGQTNAAEIEPGTRVAGCKDIVLPKGQTRLWVLSDIIVLPPSLHIPWAFSVGDVLIVAGMFLTVQWVMLGRPCRRGGPYAHLLPQQ